jgi:hypothetical protein
MINFFRKIRRKLADDNRPLKYARYAIGEIVLVVIGILIALQINNWNENKILRQQEKILLIEIYNEFNYNKTELESNLLRYKQSRESLLRIIDLFPIDIQRINFDTIASLLKQTHFVGNYDYSKTSLEKIRNTSSFDIISNIELRNLLLEWEILLADYMERELRAIDHHEEMFGPILGNYLPRPYNKGLKDPRAKLDFLNSIEFENLVKYREKKINNLFNAIEKNEHQKNIRKIINRIIELSSVE